MGRLIQHENEIKREKKQRYNIKKRKKEKKGTI